MLHIYKSIFSSISGLLCTANVYEGLPLRCQLFRGRAMMMMMVSLLFRRGDGAFDYFAYIHLRHITPAFRLSYMLPRFYKNTASASFR